MHTMILRYDGLRSRFVTLRSTDRRGSWLTEVGFYNDALLHRKWGMNIQLACEKGIGGAAEEMMFLDAAARSQNSKR